MNTAIRVRSSGQTLKAAALYFCLVFGTGFVLGTVRVLWVVPGLGVRNAELLEQPLMLVAVFLAARCIVRHFGAGLTVIETLGVGLIALGVLLLAEMLLVLTLQPNRARDPVSGAAYFAILGVFAVMPWLLSRHKASWWRRNSLVKS